MLLVPQDPDLREAAALLQRALNAPSVQEEEALWTRVIDTYGGMDRPWVPDVVSTALGVTRTGGREALWTRVIDTYGSMDRPWVPDVVSNRRWGQLRALWRRHSCVWVWLGARVSRPGTYGTVQGRWRLVPVCVRPTTRATRVTAHLAGGRVGRALGKHALHTQTQSNIHSRLWLLLLSPPPPPFPPGWPRAGQPRQCAQPPGQAGGGAGGLQRRHCHLPLVR